MLSELIEKDGINIVSVSERMRVYETSFKYSVKNAPSYDYFLNIIQYINKRDEIKIILQSENESVYSFRESTENSYNAFINDLFDDEIVYANIKIDKKMTGEDIIILKALYEKNMTIEEIVDSFGISKKTIDFCLIKNLHLFQNDIPTILLELLKRNNFSTSQIINHSYLKEEMKNLTELEKMYIYLKLDSYHNPYLDDKKIAEILGLSIRDIKYYQIMSKSDNLNELNKIFVKK